MSAIENPSENDRVYLADNLQILCDLPDESFQMIYIDPPFNTGKVQSRVTLRTVRCAEGDRIGFKGQKYSTIREGTLGYRDVHDDYLGFLELRIRQAWRLLDDTGTLYLHLDFREAHYAKVMLDEIFGRECFLNEIIWAYDYGARSKRKWPTKHETIPVYVKDPKLYWFNSEEVDREPYMAPGLVGREKAARGKLPTDVWWHTIVSPTGREKTGYPNQKPEGILRRMIQASTKPGDWVLDFFAGSGSTGYVAQTLGRHFVMIDSNPEAIEIMKKRFAGRQVSFVVQMI